jgi:hypothetical protein
MNLISRLSLKYDSPELLDHWLKHYGQEGILNFHIFLDVKDLSSKIREYSLIKKSLSQVHTQIIEIDTTTMTETEQLNHINDYRREIIGNNFAWTADADEFIKGLKFASKRFDPQKFDGIRGIVIDRFALDGKLIPLPDRDLWESFPLCSFFSRVSLNANICKVAFLRGNIRYEKVFHQAKGEEYLKFPGWNVSYHHFKWTSQLLRVENEKRNDPFFDNPFYKKELNFLYKEMIANDRVDLTEVDCWLDI